MAADLLTTAIDRALAEMPARAKQVVDRLVEGGRPATKRDRNRVRADRWNDSGMGFWNTLMKRIPEKTRGN